LLLANAEIYFCEATHYALIGNANQSSSNADAKFIIDTSQGIRFSGGADLGENENYIGECSRFKDSLIEYFSGEIGASDRLTLFGGSAGSVFFTHVRSNIFLTIIASYHGECTKA
jgi:hypothetical protein